MRNISVTIECNNFHLSFSIEFNIPIPISTFKIYNNGILTNTNFDLLLNLFSKDMAMIKKDSNENKDGGC